MKPLTQEKFISLFPHTRFRYIHDVKKIPMQGNGTLDLSWNQKGFGTFFTVNGFPPTGKADETQLVSLNASYVDFDVDASLSQEEKNKLIQEAIMSGLEASILPPTIINRTQKGVHLIWLYPNPIEPTAENIAKWKDVQKRIVHCYKGDKAAVDPSRVLRVPYTLHQKDPSNPFEIQIQSYKPEAKYTLEELDTIMPKYSTPEIDAEKTPALELLLKGVPVGEGLRHRALMQMAGLFLKGANTPEKIAVARLNYYNWDKKIVGSPERFEERKKELDNVFESILGLEIEKPTGLSKSSKSKVAIAVRACFEDIHAEPIQWLWEGRIALGKLTLLVGDPGIGKSLITAAIAAAVSKGYPWPVDKTLCPIGDVIFLSAEDDAADTIKPRLEAAGADCKRIHVLQAIKDVNTDGSPTERMFSLRHDLSTLEEMLSTLPECKLVIVDPISAYLGEKTDSHKNADVRGLLAPLATMASKHNVALLAVDHLNKNSGESNVLYRPGGSLAFVAAARAAYIVMKDKEKPERRLVMPIKNNIAKENTGLAYTVVEAENSAPIIAWEQEPVEITAAEAFAQSDSSEEHSETDWAVLFLEDLLANGRVLASEVHKEAQIAHVKNKALRRAQAKLGIQPFKDKTVFKGPWWWALPGHEDDPKNEDVPSFGEGILEVRGHLGTQEAPIGGIDGLKSA